jgi:3alpha(or 20beta)-hydroxysteroid dehydrogenase
MGRLDGKVAIITGGAGGMGVSHAKRFVEEGAKAVLAGLAGSNGESFANELGGSAIFVETDVTDDPSLYSPCHMLHIY